MPEKELNQKSEASEQTRSVLLEIAKLKEAEDEYPLGDLTSELPKEIRVEVVKTVERLKSYGLSEKILKQEAEIRAQELVDRYIDTRFDLPKGTYLRLEIIRLLDNLISGDLEEKDINGLGFISFDLNGLKAVNDLSGHEAGDSFLERSAEIFKSGQTTKELAKSGIKVLIFAGGGDEFTIVLSGQEDLTAREDKQDLLDTIRKRYEAEIASIDCADLVDLSKPETREKLEGLKIPDEFKFRATASGGSATLREIIDNYSIEGDENYYAKLGIIMGGLIDLSDQRASANKRKFKKKLSDSDDENEKFLSLILKRNIEAMELERENRGLKQRLQELEIK